MPRSARILVTPLLTSTPKATSLKIPSNLERKATIPHLPKEINPDPPLIKKAPGNKEATGNRLHQPISTGLRPNRVEGKTELTKTTNPPDLQTQVPAANTGRSTGK
jgi:hypothetical protein